MFKESPRGKTVPRSRSNRGEIHHKPDTPVVETERLSGLRKFIPDRLKGCCLIPQGPTEGERETRKTLFKHGEDSERKTNGTLFVPITKKAITPEFKTSHGGRRVGGGGTSKEAIRRAKKKQRKKKKK